MDKPYRPNIVFLDSGTVDWGDIDFAPLTALGRFRAYTSTSRRDVVKRARGAEIIVTNKVVLNAGILRELKDLKLVCVAATGVNNVDLAAAKSLGVAVANVRAYSTDSVAEHALLLSLCLCRRLKEHAQAAVSGAWGRSPFFCVADFPFGELKGKILGIAGYGAIGKKTARLAKAFGMKIIVARIPGRPSAGNRNRVPWEKFLMTSDFVTLHCPLTENTRNLIGKNELSLMKRTAFLVNVARGGLVDEKALARALRLNRIAGYAADVLAAEPPPKNHPLLARRFSSRVLLTPHVAWAGLKSRARLVGELAKNIRAFHNGKSRNRVV